MNKFHESILKRSKCVYNYQQTTVFTSFIEKDSNINIIGLILHVGVRKFNYSQLHLNIYMQFYLPPKINYRLSNIH